MLIYSIILLLLSNSVNNNRDTTLFYSRITMFILIISIINVIINIDINFFTEGIILFNGLLYLENYTFIFNVLILLLTMLIISINSFVHITNTDSKLNGINTISEQYRIIEFSLIILFSVTGTLFLISSIDIISVFLSLELQSYGLYLISAIYRNSESSVSASLTYFLLGGLSSCIILLGLCLLYVFTGTTNLENIFIINSISNTIINNNNPDEYLYVENLFNYKYIYIQYIYIQLSLTITSIGLFFKISSAPFHFWSPDVYDKIPTIVTTFVSIVPKISLLLLLYMLVTNTSSELINLSWLKTIVVSSMLSLIIGSLLGISQSRIKRLLAYSSISNIGFIQIALAVNNLESTKAMFFYIIQYTLTTLNAFLILLFIGYSLQFYKLNKNLSKYDKLENKISKENSNSPVQLISQLKGYFYVNPFISVSLIIVLFSFAGVPPLVGFFAKQMILTTSIDKGFIYLSLIAVITSVISAVYYLWIIKTIIFDENIYKLINIINKIDLNENTVGLVNKSTPLKIFSYLPFIISTLTLLTLFYMFFEYDSIMLLNNILIV